MKKKYHFGNNDTDYERYVHSSELYNLIKDSESWANEDEGLFQVTHMSMELWFVIVIQHLDQISLWLQANQLDRATGFLKRVSAIVDMICNSLRHLENMSPWNYHGIRMGLGQGSGQQSPTYNHLLNFMPQLWQNYQEILKQKEVTLDQIHQDPHQYSELYQLTSALMLFDENFMRWKFCHFQLVKRIIGDAVLSLKGVPASALEKTCHEPAFPELWAVINRTTQAYNETHGTPGLSGGYKIPTKD